jgi:uncharacterized protein (TIGR02246 family)
MTLRMSQSSDKKQIVSLCHNFLDCSDGHNAEEFAALFANDGNLVGFDGSQIKGRSETESVLRQIFADHQTATYIGKVREVRFLSPETAVLHAVLPPRKSSISFGKSGMMIPIAKTSRTTVTKTIATAAGRATPC